MSLSLSVFSIFLEYIFLKVSLCLSLALFLSFPLTIYFSLNIVFFLTLLLTTSHALYVPLTVFIHL